MGHRQTSASDKIELQQGARYSADITLGILEQYFSNTLVAKKLTELGFTSVVVSGDGKHRKAAGVWNRITQHADIDSRVSNIVKL